MKQNLRDNNKVTLAGTIAAPLEFGFETKNGEIFYTTFLKVERKSGAVDSIPVIISGYILRDEDYVGKFVIMKGNFRSKNKREEGQTRSRLILYMIVQEMQVLENAVYYPNNNEIELYGTICKIPMNRRTPLGREITDIFLAVNRPYGKSDYIPCICWGRNAKFASKFKVGSKIKIFGRIQSREYIKEFEDGTSEQRTVYEVSVNNIELAEEKENEY